ncbi:acetolactate synthase large subunit [Anaeroplasma bactoclasticum]|jgi:acetolactate synthase-1/2/3 large subunit|uniref:Acetolactate synthase n=1 Tax=Anaeroplasma bactoclasticum TaxID=2088 RepID=A0A397RNU7_9MOLU|nr:biosynthetic-type acetolactate synthase large subunit [Anaeroplasma bactoclasticum]RIA75803.1 acetolactate synthase large subunit [Anaeroplasma bactoclasticum]
MKLNGSQIIVKCLIEQGVDVIFGYPGGAVLNIYDELYKNQDKIRHILTSHEQGASHAADGYARSTGKVGVVLATSGPGATNLVTGIATAYMDSVPMVAITGNVGVSSLGKDSFQEVDITGITMPITKHNYIVKDINKLAETFREAFAIARSGRPGPVLIDIPKNITDPKCTCEYEPVEIDTKVIAKKLPKVSEDKIKEVAELINNAKRPFIFAGGGIIRANASKELNELATMMDIPTCTSLMGLGAFDQTNKLSTGLVGMHGTVASNKCIVECDLLLALGVRFSDRVLSNRKHFAENAKIVQVDIDLAEIDKNIPTDYSLVMDAKEFLDRLLPYLRPKKNPIWLALVDSWKNIFTENQMSSTLKPRFFMEEIQRATNGDCYICTEVGQHQLWAAQYFKYTKPNRLMSSGGLGTMGYGMGASIGTQIAHPEAMVFNIAGDGSFRMNLNELLTISKYNLPVCVVVANNQVLGMVRQWQTAFYEKRYSQTILDTVLDYEALAKAMGVAYYECFTRDDYSKAIEETVKLRRPTLINAHVEIDEKVLPMVAPGHQIDDIMLK